MICPPSIKKPFLPYKDAFGTLLFPTGTFDGVYYSEELKYARTLGYFIYPKRGYLFEKKESPFKGIISDLHNKRLEAKAKANESMIYIYKTLMNSLYGRFGINPENSVTEFCDESQLDAYIQMPGFQHAEELNDRYYIVNYMTNTSYDAQWTPPKMSAVHLSAAITAGARMHMYEFISREDSYYTDTDSVVLGNPLPDHLVSSTELGKFKLEYRVRRAVFLAPKSYLLVDENDNKIIKFKGPAKNLITPEFFDSILLDSSSTLEVWTANFFRIVWKNLSIIRKEYLLTLGLPNSNKREKIFNKNNYWILDPERSLT